MRHFRLHAFGFTMYLVLALLKVALVNFTFNKYIMMSNSIGMSNAAGVCILSKWQNDCVGLTGLSQLSA